MDWADRHTQMGAQKPVPNGPGIQSVQWSPNGLKYFEHLQSFQIVLQSPQSQILLFSWLQSLLELQVAALGCLVHHLLSWLLRRWLLLTSLQSHWITSKFRKEQKCLVCSVSVFKALNILSKHTALASHRGLQRRHQKITYWPEWHFPWMYKAL